MKYKTIIFIVTVAILSCSKKQEVVYTYYENGNIKSSSVIYGGNKEGEFKEYYLNGKLKTKGIYKSNFIDGVYITYYEDGRISSCCNYLNGVIQGECIEYHPTLPIKLVSSYVNNEVVAQIATDTSSNIVIRQLNSDKAISRFFNGKIASIDYLSKKSNVETSSLFMQFNEHNKLINLTGDIKLLQGSDSIDLDRSYADWREQVRLWELK